MRIEVDFLLIRFNRHFKRLGIRVYVAACQGLVFIGFVPFDRFAFSVPGQEIRFHSRFFTRNQSRSINVEMLSDVEKETHWNIVLSGFVQANFFRSPVALTCHFLY